MTKTENILFALLDSIYQMSDHAEEMGGATSISGVAALNTLQKSLQKNKPRVLKLLEELRND
jgi:hypothetical protein